ncbi:hypothetical protein ASG20_10080 [Sphingomonas sp. Leaf198]|nr:hypothetical protein ASG20_10080 [Sphingomonas sp. Leaf198]
MSERSGMPEVRTDMNAIRKSVILIVDDDALVRVHSNLALEDAGYEVVEATNAADALVKLKERPDIAALFTDVRMPGALNGIDLAHAVHAQRPDIAILVTSGADNGASSALPAAAQFLQKPYTKTQLSQMLQHGQTVRA